MKMEVLVNAENVGFTGGTNEYACFLVYEAVDIGMHVPTILTSFFSPCSSGRHWDESSKTPAKSC
jgi:hypothetical protein